MSRQLCSFDRGTYILTTASLIAWIFFVLDLSTDVGYYSTTSKHSSILQYGMLISMIAPHLFNMVSVASIMVKRRDG